MLAWLQTLPLRRIFAWVKFGIVDASSTQSEPLPSREPVPLSDRDRDQAAEVSFWGLAAFPVL